MGFVVAVDGPAGSGKGTVTKLIGKKKNLIYIDTGAMYRCVTLYLIENNIDIKKIELIEKSLENIKIELKIIDDNQEIYLNEKNVSKVIRTEKVDKLVSPVSKIKCVREKLTNDQRKMAEDKDIIMEGRDIGTIVFPNADVKIYLDATPEERANRRYKQNIENGINDSTYSEILEEIKERDYRDSHRELSPLKQAEDAVYIDSSNMTIEEVVDKIIKIIEQREYKI